MNHLLLKTLFCKLDGSGADHHYLAASKRSVLLSVNKSIQSFQSTMFKKPAELPRKPEIIFTRDVYDDLQVHSGDPLLSDAVKQIIAVNDPFVDPKSASSSWKTFDSVNEILKLKEDMSSQKKLLLEKFDNLSSLRDKLKLASPK